MQLLNSLVFKKYATMYSKRLVGLASGAWTIKLLTAVIVALS